MMLFKELKLWVRSLHPRYWIQMFKQSKEVDRRVRRLINSRAKVQVIDSYYTMLDDTIVWTTNFPYGYGSIVQSDKNKFIRGCGSLPSRRTRILLYDYIAQELCNDYR